MTITNASRMLLRAWVARPASEPADCSSVVRSDQSFSVAKASAMFGPVPEKLKPTMLTMAASSGCFIMYVSTSFITSTVRSWVAPGGSCTFTITKP